MDELFQRLMEEYYDPAYSRSLLKNYPQFEGSVPVELDRLDHSTLVGVARTLHSTAVTT